MIASLFRSLPEARTAYGSHLPTLGRALDLVPQGPVLELGMGDCSTLPLHQACRLQKRVLRSYEHDPGWLTRFLHLKQDWHSMTLVSTYDAVPIEAERWGVALVDHGPMARRPIDLVRLRTHASVIVCHDSEPRRRRERESYWFGKIFPQFRFRWDEKSESLPWTTVVSDVVDVETIWSGELVE